MRQERINEIWGVLLFAVTVLVLVSLISYDQNDLSWFTSHPNSYPQNYAGIIGAHIGAIFFSLIGFTAYVIPLLTATWAVGKFLGKVPQKFYVKMLGTSVLFIAVSAFLSMLGEVQDVVRVYRGGLAGLFFSDIFIRYFGRLGAYIIVITLGLLSMLLATELLILPIFLSLVNSLIGFASKFLAGRPRLMRQRQSDRDMQAKRKPEIAALQEKRERIVPGEAKGEPRKIINIQKILKKDESGAASVNMTKRLVGDYRLPDLDLLDSPPPFEERKIKDDLDANARILVDTLGDFGIEVKVAAVERGPVITRYELEPAPGVKVTKITSLSDDIALAMKAQSVRIVAPIPGKARVGVEVPNSASALVYLKEVLQTREFQGSKSKLTLALGKDIGGNAAVADLGDMPHLLIAGTTGSGKTVCVNTIITSMLFNATPDEVKFLMVDPKMVELAAFNGLPHLLCPVVTESNKVSGALNWVVNEMDSRYKLFARLGVRNIEFFNEKKRAGELEGLDDVPETLPYIVVIIDELADLMLVAAQEVENAITRLSQLSRAVGIHIILATQRPSVDVVTGVIKANFPARISFQVASKVDSRTVLDANGADKLLGKGDMLFLKPGESKPIRAQGSLVSDREIERIVDFIKGQREPAFDDEILKAQEKRLHGRTFEKDELYEEAVKMVMDTKQASVSMLQRRLGLGYTRAARLIDTMEADGIVGSYRGSKPREILIEDMEGVKAKWNQSAQN